MRITTEDIRRIIKEELRALLSEKEAILPKELDQRWQIWIYSTKEAMEDSNIKSTINRKNPQPYEGEKNMCRKFESSSDPEPRHIMITPELQEEIGKLATSSKKPFKQIEGQKEFSKYLNGIQETAIATAKLVWKRIKDYYEDPKQHMYVNYSCTDNFGKMMTYIEADKGFLPAK